MKCALKNIEYRSIPWAIRRPFASDNIYIGGGGTKHEIEIQRGYRRAMNCRGRIPNQDCFQAHFCQSSHNRVQ